MNVVSLKLLAKIYGWTFLTYQEDIKMISFTKGTSRINVYTTKMTVATCLKHPKQGKTQMFRKNVTSEEMREILDERDIREIFKRRYGVYFQFCYNLNCDRS